MFATEISTTVAAGTRSLYHDLMMEYIDHEPPFDPRWLESLADLAQRPEAGERLHDLYLERRLETRVSATGAHLQFEESRSEGVAARWKEETGIRIAAITGTTPRAVHDLLMSRIDCRDIQRFRALPAPEIDPPRSWREWASELVHRLASADPQIVFMSRSAAIVNRHGWAGINSPPLVRLKLRGELQSSLLAVWGHPRLSEWIDEMAVAPPTKRWQPPSGRPLDTVFASGTGGALIHELVGHLLEADIVNMGDSPFRELDDTVVAPAGFRLVDDPTRQDLPGAFDRDDEGVEAQPISLIEDGQLRSVLCDQRFAAALGCPAGRGRRASWNRPPVPRMSNLIVAPGTAPPEALESSVRAGIVVARITGARVDPLSGRVVIRVEKGWELRNGRRRRPLGDCELIGSALSVLKGIETTLGNDPAIDWRLGWCVKGGWPIPTGSESPTMLVRGLEVL